MSGSPDFNSKCWSQQSIQHVNYRFFKTYHNKVLDKNDDVSSVYDDAIEATDDSSNRRHNRKHLLGLRPVKKDTQLSIAFLMAF